MHKENTKAKNTGDNGNDFIADVINVLKRTLERKEAAYACVCMWYEKEYDSSTPNDEVASMDKEAAELNAQIKVLRHILSEVGEL